MHFVGIGCGGRLRGYGSKIRRGCGAPAEKNAILAGAAPGVSASPVNLPASHQAQTQSLGLGRRFYSLAKRCQTQVTMGLTWRQRYATASASISTTNRGSASPATNSSVEAGACSPNNAARAAR
jgi:hypothetical protein